VRSGYRVMIHNIIFYNGDFKSEKSKYLKTWCIQKSYAIVHHKVEVA
jgi:hypothetical protein